MVSVLMKTIYFQIKQIPDLSLKKYSALEESGVDGLLKRQKDFLAQWHGICRAAEAGLHLFLYFNKAKQVGEQLEIYLGINCASEERKQFS